MAWLGPPRSLTGSNLVNNAVYLVFSLDAQVAGRAQESYDSTKQSAQEAWDNTKAQAQETADKVMSSPVGTAYICVLLLSVRTLIAFEFELLRDECQC
jgi:hypothetical protein